MTKPRWQFDLESERGLFLSQWREGEPYLSRWREGSSLPALGAGRGEKDRFMAEALITTKIQPRALRLLRRIAAETGERQYEALARLIAEEARRLNLEKENR